MVRTLTLLGTPSVFYVGSPLLAYIKGIIKVQRSGVEYDPWFTTIEGELVNPGNRQYYHSNSDGNIYFNNEQPFSVSPPTGEHSLLQRLEKIHIIYDTL